LFLLKLAIIEELGIDPAPLIESQSQVVRDVRGLKSQLARASLESEQIVLLYRTETAKALERFLVRQAAASVRVRPVSTPVEN
jgi:hypothetical protein